MYYIEKLKEKWIPDLEDYIFEDNTYLIQTEKVDLFFHYIEEINEVRELNHIVTVTAFFKGTDEYVWFFELSQFIYNGKKYTRIPNMFLSNKRELRWNWYMLEMQYAIIEFIRQHIPFYKNEVIYSWSCLSDNSISFYNKWVNSDIPYFEKTNKKLINKWYPPYTYLF